VHNDSMSENDTVPYRGEQVPIKDLPPHLQRYWLRPEATFTSAHMSVAARGAATRGLGAD
jgi:hypothetical protein